MQKKVNLYYRPSSFKTSFSAHCDMGMMAGMRMPLRKEKLY